MRDLNKLRELGGKAGLGQCKPSLQKTTAKEDKSALGKVLREV
jgi:hypothetical protein